MNRMFGLDTGKKDQKRASFWIASIYGAVAVTWIVVSDQVLLRFYGDNPNQLTIMHTIYDGLFVMATAALVGWMAHRFMGALGRRDEHLREIAQGIAMASGEAFFSSLANSLSEALKAEISIVCRLTGPGNRQVRTLAISAGGKSVENFECHWEGTPFEIIFLERKSCIIPKGACWQFPASSPMGPKKVEAIIGMPLINSDGRMMGAIVVMDTKPFASPDLTKEILKIFAVRAAIELDQKLRMDGLGEQNAHLGAILNELGIGIYVADLPTGEILFLNRLASSMLGIDEKGLRYKDLLKTLFGDNGAAVALASGKAGKQVMREVCNTATRMCFRHSETTLEWEGGRIARLGTVTEMGEMKKSA